MAPKRSRESDDGSNEEPIAKRQPKILDGTYYKLNEDEPESDTAQCVVCTSFIKGGYSSTGNFYKNFRRRHPLKLNELRNYCNVISNPVSQNGQLAPPPVCTLDPEIVSIDIESIHIRLMFYIDLK